MCHSQIDQITRGDKLLRAARANERELPGAAPFCAALEKVHEQAVSSMTRRRALVAAAREATEQLNRDLVAVQDASIALRSFIKGVLGFRNVKLGQYGIKPIRQRGRLVRRRPL